MRENELLNSKLIAVENDLKLVLNNRSKIDNLEDIIFRFVNENKANNENVVSNNKTTSTKFMSREFPGKILII